MDSACLNECAELNAVGAVYLYLHVMYGVQRILQTSGGGDLTCSLREKAGASTAR